jgi:hypothetical protein
MKAAPWALALTLNALGVGAAFAQVAVTTTTHNVVCGIVSSTTKVDGTQEIPFEYQTAWSFRYPAAQIDDDSAVDCCHFTFGADSVGLQDQPGAVYTFYNLNPAEDNNPGHGPSWLWSGVQAVCPDYTASHTITFGSTCRDTLTSIPASLCPTLSSTSAVPARRNPGRPITQEDIAAAVSAVPDRPALVPAGMIFSRDKVIENINQVGQSFKGRTFDGEISPLGATLLASGCTLAARNRVQLGQGRRSASTLYDCAKGFVVVSENQRRIPEKARTLASALWSFNYLRDETGRRSSLAQRRDGDTYLTVNLFHADSDEHAWLARLVGQDV